MKNYYYIEQYLQRAKQQNINRKSCLIAIDCMIETIKKFDRKVYNKRFDSFLDEKLVDSGLNHTSFSIVSYGAYFYVRDNDSYKTGEYSCDYVDYTYYIPELFSSDKRIIAENLIPLFESRKVDISKDIQSLESDVKNIAQIEAEYNNIMSQIKDFNKSHARETRMLFELKEY